MLTLDIVIPTHRAPGIRNVAKMLPAPEEGVRYVVSWQNYEEGPLPDRLELPDVEVHRFDGAGISANRNNALAHAHGDIVLFADDDLVLYPEGIREVRRIFSDDATLELATFMSDHADMGRFPEEQTDLRQPLPRGYSVATFEMAFRNSGRSGSMRFCPELGVVGGRYSCGEDEMFLLTAIKRGLRCRFYPVKVCAHPHVSTGYKKNLPDGALRASGVVISLFYGWQSLLRIPLKALRLRRRGQAGFFRAMRLMTAGAIGANRLRKRNPDSMW